MRSPAAWGVKLAGEAPRGDRHGWATAAYLMLNSEIATSVMLGLKLTIVVLDNRGFACINRLQQSVGAAPFNNLIADARGEAPDIDFAAHAASLGAIAEKVDGIAALEAAFVRAKASPRTHVIVIDTDPKPTTGAGGAWWDVPVPEVSDRPAVTAARTVYDQETKSAGPGMSVRFGVSPIAWVNDDMPELGGDTTVEAIVSDAAALGFDGDEEAPRRQVPQGPGGPACVCWRPSGLDLIGGLVVDQSAGATRPRTRSRRPRGHIALLKALGSQVFIAAETSNAIHGERGTPLGTTTPRLMAGGLAGVRRAAECARRVCREPGPASSPTIFTWEPSSERPEDLDAFVAHTHPNVGFVVDTGHAALGEVDAVALIRRHREQVVHVHTKDIRRPVFDANRAAGRNFLDGVLAGMFTAPGDGDLDFGPVMAALADINYSGWIVIEAEQDPKLADPVVYSRLGLKTLKAAASTAAGLIPAEAS